MVPRRPRLPLVIAFLAGCAATKPPPSTPPIDIALKTATGAITSLAELHGHPTLLLLFATYDATSQLAWGPLLMTREDFPSLQVLGIALEPNAERLLPLYGESLGLTEMLTFEVEPAIVSGQSALGVVEGIPHYVLLDAEGRVLARRTGVTKASELREWLSEHLGPG